MTDQQPSSKPPTDSYWTDAPVPGDPDPAAAPRRNASLKMWIGAAVVAFLLGGAAVAVLNRSDSSSASSTGAAATNTDGSNGATSSNGGGGAGGSGQGRFGGRGTSGTIASIDGSKLTVTGTDGSTTSVVTNDSTVVTTSVTLDLSNIAVGDQVTVMGTTTDTTVAAERIVDNGTEDQGAGGPTGQPPSNGGQFTPPDGSGGGFPGQGQGPAGGFGGLVRGEVTAVDGSTLTVKSQDGTTYTVTTSSSTTVTRTQTGSLADLAVGDEVTVIGETGSDGTVTAARISEGSGFVGGFGGGGNGPPVNGSNGNGTTPTTT